MTHDHPDTSRSADDLHAVLRDWRWRRDAAVDSGALAAQVVAAVRTDAPLAAPPVGLPPQRRWRERTAWFTAGMAAAATLAVVLQSPRGDQQADWPPTVRFAAGQVAEKAALVAGMDDTFGPRLAWIAEHDRRVDVGLVPDALPDRGTALAVRIVVLSRRVGATQWTPVWQADVVTRDEQLVDVAAGPGGAGRLRLWTHPLPDGAIAVDGELALAAANPPVAASFSGVQRPDDPQRVSGRRADDVEWQVIQTVVPLGARDSTTDEVG